jgi:hypothetical protein
MAPAQKKRVPPAEHLAGGTLAHLLNAVAWIHCHGVISLKQSLDYQGPRM